MSFYHTLTFAPVGWWLSARNMHQRSCLLSFSLRSLCCIGKLTNRGEREREWERKGGISIGIDQSTVYEWPPLSHFVHMDLMELWKPMEPVDIPPSSLCMCNIYLLKTSEPANNTLCWMKEGQVRQSWWMTMQRAGDTWELSTLSVCVCDMDARQ